MALFRIAPFVPASHWPSAGVVSTLAGAAWIADCRESSRVKTSPGCRA